VAITFCIVGQPEMAFERVHPERRLGVGIALAERGQ
jgi:hypothetical protein